MMDPDVRFRTFSWRVTTVHMVAYLTAGLAALVALDYQTLFATGSLAGLMRPVDSPVVAWGPFLQVVLGFALSVILFPFRAVFLGSTGGWTALFLLITGFCLFTPQVPGPGNFEGLVYTTISLPEHLLSLPETLLYSLLFSALVVLWHRHPRRLWNVLAVTAVVLILLMGLLGSWAAPLSNPGNQG